VKVVYVTHARLGVSPMLKGNPHVLNAPLGCIKMMKKHRIVKIAPLEKVTVGQQERTSMTVTIVNQVNIKDLQGCLLVSRVAPGKVNPMTDKLLVSDALWVNPHQVLDLRSGKKILVQYCFPFYLRILFSSTDFFLPLYRYLFYPTAWIVPLANTTTTSDKSIGKSFLLILIQLKNFLTDND
jgi:hypothetical protein